MAPSLLGLFVAVALDALLGDPPTRFHPVGAMGRFIRRGSQLGSGGKVRLFIAGLALLIVGGALFSFPWAAVSVLAGSLPWWLQGIILGVALKPTFTLRRLLEAGRDIRRELERGNLPEARRLLHWHLVSRDTDALTPDLACSAVIESLAENLTDGFLAPLLCFAFGGLTLAWFYRFVNTADSVIGYRTQRYEHLGKAAARVDDALNFIPARLTAALLVASAAMCSMKAGSAWRAMTGQHGRTSSPNAGWTMAAAAGALGVRLQKVGYYVLEGGNRLPDCRDVHDASRLVSVGAALGCIVGGGLAYGIGRLF